MSGDPLLAAFQAALAHPVLAAVRVPAARLLDGATGFPEVAAQDAVLAPLAGVRFVVQAPRPRRRRRAGEDLAAASPVSERYDGLITLRGEVPTRARSAHDLLNALAWAAFPQAKRAIHARQFRAQERLCDAAGRPPARRSREQDILTMLDEGGVVVAATSAAAAAAQAALEAGAHVELGALLRSGQAAAHVLGHALTEHVVLGRAGVPRATVVVVTVDAPHALSGVDAALRARVADPAVFLAPDPWPGVPLDLLVGGWAGEG